MIIRTVNTNESSIDLLRKYEEDIDIVEHFKPCGLWYQINGSWVDWCNSNCPDRVGKNNFKILLDLKNILILDTSKKLKDFNIKYKDTIFTTSQHNFEFNLIDWNKVKKDYKGIEIRNYHKIKNMGFTFLSISFVWFLGWDVDSGCIWDLTAIKNVNCDV
jgi:hypothetical protein